MSWRARIRRWLEDWLPWYDPEAERAVRARSEALSRREEETSSKAAKIRSDYAIAASRLARR